MGRRDALHGFGKVVDSLRGIDFLRQVELMSLNLPDDPFWWIRELTGQLGSNGLFGVFGQGTEREEFFR
jgi:hypothetical protein